jgi:hypothetical protein
MEPGRVELPSVLAHNAPLIHRFIHSDPHGGNYLLSSAAEILLYVLRQTTYKRKLFTAPVGGYLM